MNICSSDIVDWAMMIGYLKAGRSHWWNWLLAEYLFVSMFLFVDWRLELICWLGWFQWSASSGRSKIIILLFSPNKT